MANVYSSGYDISNRNNSIYSQEYNAYVNRWEEEEKLKQLYEDKGTLDFADMLQLMIAQFQNQTIDNQASTNDMMNQLVQMSTMQAMNSMVESVGELQLASVMSYAASLVTQKVTVFDGYDEDGNMIERVGTVTGMGTYGGQQVIFVDGKDMYYLSSILAVGELPPKETEDPEEDEEDVPVPPIKEDDEVDDPDNNNNNDIPAGDNGADTYAVG